jgi:hypothetical protein
VLNSRSANPIDVTPTFYTTDGNAIVGNPVQLQPAEIRFVPVEELMPEALRGRHRWGGIALSFTGNVLEVWAQITFHGVGGGSVDETFNILEEPGSDTREAVWRMPKKSTAVIALGNSSNVAIRTTAQFSDGDSEDVDVPSGATRFIRRHAREDDTQSVKLTTAGPEGSMRVTGFIIADDESFTSSIRFYDTKKIVQPNLYATNLRLKNTVPRMVLKNTSAVDISARPRFFAAAGEQANPMELPTITLRPQQVVEVDLSVLGAAAASRTDLDSVSVQVLNSGAPGSLIGAAYSRERATQLTHDVPLRDSGKNRNGTGSYPWRVDRDYSTVVAVTNFGNQPARFQVELRYSGGPYSIKPRELAVGETATFDLRKIRDEQQPDRLGHVLPLTLEQGQFHWSTAATPGESHIIGRAEVVSRSGHVSSSYSCPVCCADSGPTGGFDPHSYSVSVDGLQQAGSSGVYYDCYNNFYTTSIFWTSLYSSNSNIATINGSEQLYGVTSGGTYANGSYDSITWWNDGMDCYQQYYNAGDIAPVEVNPKVEWTTPSGVGNGGGVPMSTGTAPQGSLAYVNTTTITATGTPSGGSYSWSTTSNKVTLANTTSATVTVTAVSESDTTGDVTIVLVYTQNNQSTPPVNIPFTVQKPTFMDFVSIGTGTADPCPATDPGPRKNITWQVADKNHNPISFRLPLSDTLTNVTPNSCSNPAAGEGTAPGRGTGTGGRWEHRYRMCSTACANGGSCSVAGTQKYFIQGFEISLGYTMTCTSISVGGH